MRKVELSFEAGEGRHFCGGVNFMTDRDGLVYAECQVPDGASDDYGYIAMKNALLKAVGGKIALSFWYPDDQDNLLADDASADCDVYTDIDSDITKEGPTMITVSLANRSAIFDSGNFETIREAIEFAKGRGGKYVVQIGHNDSIGASLSYDSDKDQFSRFDGWEWETICESEIETLI